MGCSCHINPPCNYCLDQFECGGCHKLKNQSEDGINYILDDPFCDYCFVIATEPKSGTVCECGKDNHGFPFHSDWCPKF